MVQLLEISTRPYRTHPVVSLRGELDLAGVADLRVRLRKASDGWRHVVVDLEDLTFIDSCGLSVLVEFHNKTHLTGGSLRIVAPQPQVTKVFRITGLDQHLRIYDRLEDAIA